MQKPGLFGMNGFMVLVLTCFTVAGRAQQPGYLILVDAESKQPFTARVGDQLYTSSSHGHLVIPRLKDSSYKLNFRFLKKGINDRVFVVAIHQRDQGFQLKGNDSSYLLYNWQTRENIRPVLENDSSHLLEQGIKRDDGFSRLMAAVVNDTAVMYNTYSGNGFQRDSSGVYAQRGIPPAAGQAPNAALRGTVAQRSTPPAAGQAPSPAFSGTGAERPTPSVAGITAGVVGSTDKGPPPTPNPAFSGTSAQRPTPNAERTTVILNKDSLLEVKRKDIHYQDSLNTVRKAASRDSLLASRKQMAFLKDSLNTARRAFVKDSLASAKKQQLALKDSLIAARKATKDSLLAIKKAGAVQEGVVMAEKNRVTDSLLAVKRANATRDSLLAVNQSNSLKDSLARGVASRSTNKPSRVKKLREVSLKVSRKMVFLDIGSDGQVDTITLFVYFETKADHPSINPPVGNVPAVQKPVLPDSVTVKKPPLKSKNSDTISRSVMVPKSKGADTTGSGKTLQKKTVLKPVDASCSQVATEEDTQLLRLAILKANSEQDKISVATGAFAMKCFSVSQVRLLAGLLVSDKAKYSLMDAAHLHVADRDHFPELVDMLTDKNFQRKFLVMAEKRS